jgi:NADH:ubiquinone oxidoreductase subunit 6 (subunit J)
MMNSFGGSGMHGWGPAIGFGVFGILMAIFLLAVLALKGYALWHAAKRDEKWWFIALLVLNTAGILELVYLIFIVKKWPKIYNGPKASSSTSATNASTNTHENNNGPKAN